jgi:hypothetical protein
MIALWRLFAKVSTFRAGLRPGDAHLPDSEACAKKRIFAYGCRCDQGEGADDQLLVPIVHAVGGEAIARRRPLLARRSP